MKKNTKDLDFLVNCSDCGHPFASKDIFLVSEGEGQTVFHTTCSNCFTCALVFIKEGSRGITGVSLVTDLDRSEVREKFVQEKVTTDDVVEIYQTIRETRGRIGNILSGN